MSECLNVEKSKKTGNLLIILMCVQAFDMGVLSAYFFINTKIMNNLWKFADQTLYVISITYFFN
jgi:hypothetical protein